MIAKNQTKAIMGPKNASWRPWVEKLIRTMKAPPKAKAR